MKKTINTICFTFLFFSAWSQSAVLLPQNTNITSDFAGRLLDVVNNNASNNAYGISGTTNATTAGSGIIGIAANRFPTGHAYGIKAENSSTNNFGYGIFGSHLGTGTGIFGYSLQGTGIRAEGGANGIIAISTNGYGIRTTANNNIAILATSDFGTAGYFSGAYSLITAGGKIGLGTNTPTKSFLVVDGKEGASHAIFGENTSGVSIESDYPGISFNGYYNAGRKAIVDGFVGGMAMNPSNGTITIYSTGVAGTSGNNTTPTDKILISNNGNVSILGTATASCGLLICSDVRFKKNIFRLNNSLANLLKINGVSYDLRTEDYPEKNFSGKPQIGFIAQDLEKIFPELVLTDEKGYKSVDYAKITPLLVEAIKEQQKQLVALQVRVNELDELKAEMLSFRKIMAKNENSNSVDK